MKKRIHPLKLSLNKQTISNITKEHMITLRAGGDPTDIGETCYTGPCCRTNDCQLPATNGFRLLNTTQGACTHPRFC